MVEYIPAILVAVYSAFQSITCTKARLFSLRMVTVNPYLSVLDNFWLLDDIELCFLTSL